jgi:predicted ester cyclase
VTTLIENKQIAREIVEKIYNDRNLGEVDRLIAPNYLDHAIPVHEPNGIVGMRTHLDMLWQAFPDGRQDILSVFGENDIIGVISTFTGTHRGMFAGFPATGRAVRLAMVQAFRMELGACAEHWGGFEAELMMRQLALSLLVAG